MCCRTCGRKGHGRCADCSDLVNHASQTAAIRSWIAGYATSMLGVSTSFLPRSASCLNSSATCGSALPSRARSGTRRLKCRVYTGSPTRSVTRSRQSSWKCKYQSRLWFSAGSIQEGPVRPILGIARAVRDQDATAPYLALAREPKRSPRMLPGTGRQRGNVLALLDVLGVEH